MIEVLVASTILVVIVMMLAMLFQQTSMAWRTGVRRADSFMQVRSAVGAIQRDASAAIDASSIPDALKTALGGGKQTFSGSALQFYTLTGTGFADNRPGGMPLRALSYITYSKEGQRTETVLQGDGSGWKKPESNVMKFVTNKDNLKTSFQGFEPEFGDLPTVGLPLFVILKADIELAGFSYDIGAASAGPDKTWGTKDDIRTWVEE